MHAGRARGTMLELGSGGGNTASFLKRHYRITLCDRSEQMLDRQP
jgi:ubiquinone/menaquinone biosynthesis C-methylase UbiE